MLSDWQQHFTAGQRERIRKLGLLTGLRYKQRRGFWPANFERGLVLQRLVALARPKAVLELGTGRGLGVLSIADAVREQQLDCTILSVDIISPTTKQAWPIEIEGVQQDMQASIDDIWSRHVEEDLRKRILLRTGKTTSVLPALVKQGRKFDVIFIDAGHDVFSVIHDLSYAAVLLATDGAILLDDFAPLEEFGIGTCIAVAHARRWFGQVETFATEGLVYGGAAVAGAPRGMALIKGPFEPHPHVRRSSFVWWRFAAAVLARCYRPAVFPLAQ